MGFDRRLPGVEAGPLELALLHVAMERHLFAQFVVAAPGRERATNPAEKFPEVFHGTVSRRLDTTKTKTAMRLEPRLAR
jgi:hypothetical protein